MPKGRYIYKPKQKSNIVLLHIIKRVDESRIFFLSFNPTIISHLCTVKTIADELPIKRGSKTTH